MVKSYAHNDTTQLSPHFNVKEFKCQCGRTHDTKVSEELVANLEKLFDKLDCSKIIISSGYRCADHDKEVGGSGNGQHVVGTAADLCCYDKSGSPISSKKVCCAAQDLGFKGIANINAAYQYLHLDMRSGARWFGDETKGNGTVTDDFYKYFNISKEDKPLKNGIDISWCQTSVDWNKVKTDFVIIQIGGGRVKRKKDDMFESHYAGAKSKGIPVGAYWFVRASNEKEAIEEADICLSIIKGKQFEYPIYADVEGDILNLSNDELSNIVEAFIDRVEKAGYWTGLYMSGSPMHDKIRQNILDKYALWIADVRGVKPDYISGYGAWQYSWKGSISGITGDVDLDYCYVDYSTKIKDKGLNGFGTVEEDVTNENKDETEVSKPTVTIDSDGDIDVEITIDGEKYKGTLAKE